MIFLIGHSLKSTLENFDSIDYFKSSILELTDDSLWPPRHFKEDIAEVIETLQSDFLTSRTESSTI